MATALLGDLAQVLHLGQRLAVRTRRARERRQVRRHERQVERRRPADLGRPLDDARVAGEAAGLLGTRAQVRPGGGRQPRVELGEAATGPDGSDGGGQLALRRRGVVDVVGGHALDAGAVGDLGEGVVAGRVERVAVVPQLDQDAVAAERLDQPLELAAGGRRAVIDERRRHRPLATAGECPRMAGHAVGHIGERELRCSLLAGQMAEAQGPGEAAVPGWSVGEQHEVTAGRVGGVRVGDLAGVDLEQRVGFDASDPLVVGETRGERDLGAEHGGDADLTRRLGEAHHPVEPVVVGDGDRLEAEPGGFGGELLGVRRAVEEREVGVAVELGVGHRARRARDGRLERLAAAGSTPARRRRRSTTGCRRRARRVRRAPTARLRARPMSTTGC